MAARFSIRIPGGNGNIYHTMPPFASLYEKFQLTLITFGAQRQPPQYLSLYEAIARLGVGKGDKRTDSETGGDVPSC
jgi:hypothetical protein